MNDKIETETTEKKMEKRGSTAEKAGDSLRGEYRTLVLTREQPLPIEISVVSNPEPFGRELLKVAARAAVATAAAAAVVGVGSLVGGLFKKKDDALDDDV